MKPIKAWMVVDKKPDPCVVVEMTSVYRLRRDALEDCDPTYQRVIHVEIRPLARRKGE